MMDLCLREYGRSCVNLASPPELFKVKGKALPPSQSAGSQQRSSAGHTAQLGTGSFGNKSCSQWHNFQVSFEEGAILYCGSGVQR